MERAPSDRIEIELTEVAPSRARRGRRGRDHGSAPQPAGPPTAAPAGAPLAPPTGAASSGPSPFARPGASPRPEFTYDAGPLPARDVAPPADAVVVTGEPDPGPLGTERRRLVATGLAAGAVALLLGWGLGRSGDGSARTVDPPATTRGPNTTVAATLLPGETIPKASIPTTTRPRPSTTTTTTIPQQWITETVEIDPAAAGLTDRLVMLTGDHHLIELDLATGELRSSSQPVGPRGPNPMSVLAGADWVIVQYDNGSAPDVYLDDAFEPQTVPTGQSYNIYPDAQAGTLWAMSFTETGAASELVEIDPRTGPTGRRIDTRGLWPTLPDPAGGVVVGDAGLGMYTVGPDASARLGDGRVVAIGAEHLMTYVCGATFDDCAFWLTDRATGERRPVPIDPAEEAGIAYAWWNNYVGSQISPDGRFATALVPSTTGPPETVVIDTTTGKVTRMPAALSQFSYTYQTPLWSSDGRRLLVVIGGLPSVYDPATGDWTALAVHPALRTVSFLALRPAA